jgi:cyclic beta-1,2-glucan synthetase
MARNTWRYFDEFVTEADAWLAPDNYQDDGEVRRLARRTSPTNIGMSLLSTLAAHDFGYLSTDALLHRLNGTLGTLDRLERHEGHFFNWYDTSSLGPLSPRYVSTVDSGNLAGALIALAQGLLQLEERPQTLAQRLAGLADTADWLATATKSSDARIGPLQSVVEVNRLARAIVSAARADEATGVTAAIQVWGSKLASASAELGGPGPAAPLNDVTYWCRAVLEGVKSLTPQAVSVESLRTLAGRVAAVAEAMRFEFLYDQRRRIFSIGYRLADAEGPGRLDTSFYDLLAS